jgi:transposase
MNDVRVPTYDELLIENAQQKQEIAQLKAHIVEQDQRIAELQAKHAEEITLLKSQIDKLTKMLFGKKSEKSKKDKAEKQQPSSESSEEPPVEPKQPRKNNGGGGRTSFPSGIPRRDVRVDLHPDECRCPICGKDYKSMGVEVTEVLNYIPMILEVIRFIRERMKAACDCLGTKIIIAEMPIRTICKGMVTTEFVSAVLVNKYSDHNPVYRQVNRLFKSTKVEIAESSVCRWRDHYGKQLQVISNLMKARIKQSYCINTDASTAPCRLPKEKHRQVSGNMYVYIGGDDQPFNIFDFQPNQKAQPIHDFLKGYSGVVQCDAHGNYDALFAPTKIDAERPPPKECGCHAHCRRGFKDSEKLEPVWSKQFLDLYKKLYKIESEIKELTLEERLCRRQRDSVPILDALFDWCRECKNDPLTLPKSPLGQACAYALKNEVALRRYCTDARLNIDNNVSERALRAFVIGRKNWLFFGSPEAAKWSAVIMSVLSSAKRHGLDEWEYLVDLIYRLDDWTGNEDSFESLLPDRWVKSLVPPTEAAALVAAKRLIAPANQGLQSATS